ncbi:MAG: class I tRNA ligase family protein, partial [Lachnospiraceae bacterium]|nr:class I tRNA ligase family protein [Candidatus Minthocola equi]
MNTDEIDTKAFAKDMLEDADKWILTRAGIVIEEVTDNLEKYELGIALSKIYDFVWEELCDWYIEMVKPRFRADSQSSKIAAAWTLKKVLIDSLKLLHPYMPFITEEIFCNLQDEEETIMLSAWPTKDPELTFPEVETSIEMVKEAIRKVRELRLSMNVPPSKKARVFVVAADEKVREAYKRSEDFFKTLASASELDVQADKTGIADNAVSAVIAGAALFLPLEELVDMAKERERLEKEAERLKGEIKRCEGMLSNEKFISKAPEAKIAEERGKLSKYNEMLAQVNEQLSHM